jgi:hypothetical protein
MIEDEIRRLAIAIENLTLATSVQKRIEDLEATTFRLERKVEAIEEPIEQP